MTTLITGGSGFAGSHLLDRLVGHGPIAAWHRPGKPTPSRPASVAWRGVDLRDRAAVVRAIEETRPARIFHIAGAPNVDAAWRNVLPHLETNVLATDHLLEAVRRLDAPCRVLIVTSAMIYRSSETPVNEDVPLVPSTPYGLSKLAQDQLALRAGEEDGLDVVVARPFNHAGPRQDPSFVLSSFARQIARIEAGLEPPELRVGNLEARRDFTDVRDVVRAYEQLMTSAPGGRAFNISSGRAVRIGDLLDAVLRAARLPVRVTTDEARLRPSDTPVVLGDATRIRTEIGWSPEIPLERTLLDTLDWWRGQVTRT